MFLFCIESQRSEKAINDVFTEGGREDIESSVVVNTCNLWNNKQTIIAAERRQAAAGEDTDVKVI